MTMCIFIPGVLKVGMCSVLIHGSHLLTPLFIVSLLSAIFSGSKKNSLLFHCCLFAFYNFVLLDIFYDSQSQAYLSCITIEIEMLKRSKSGRHFADIMCVTIVQPSTGHSTVKNAPQLKEKAQLLPKHSSDVLITHVQSDWMLKFRVSAVRIWVHKSRGQGNWAIYVAVFVIGPDSHNTGQFLEFAQMLL